MAEGTDTATAAQNTDTTQGAAGEAATQNADAGMRFTPEQQQQIASMVGRIVANQLQEKVVPLVQSQGAKTVNPTAPEVPSNLKELNETLQNMIFEGKVTDAFQTYINLQSQASQDASTRKNAEIKRALTGFAEDPNYKALYVDAESRALRLGAQGYPAIAAAHQAMAEAKAAHFEKVATTRGEDDDMKLGMSTGSGGKGTRNTKSKIDKTPFKAAAARDIAAGVFKDEAEYIAHLSPEIRARYELD